MKQLISVLIVLMLSVCVAYASNIDWSCMTDDEINEAIVEAKEELANRSPVQNDDSIRIANGTVILDYDGFTVTVEGEPWISDSGERQYIYFTAVAENNSTHDYMVAFDDVSINGWEQNGYGFSLVGAGKKDRNDCYFYATDAQIHSFDDIKEFLLKITVLDSEYKTVYKTDETQFVF